MSEKKNLEHEIERLRKKVSLRDEEINLLEYWLATWKAKCRLAEKELERIKKESR